MAHIEFLDERRGQGPCARACHAGAARGRPPLSRPPHRVGARTEPGNRRPLGSDQPPAGIDIDRVVGEGSIEALSSALSGQNAAYESGLAIPGIARIARRSGVTSMTTDPILPALLVALET